MHGLRLKLDTARIVISHDKPGEGHDSHLHSQADSKIWDFLPSCIYFCRQNHAFCAPSPKPSRHENSIHATKMSLHIFFRNRLGICPAGNGISVWQLIPPCFNASLHLSMHREAGYISRRWRSRLPVSDSWCLRHLNPVTTDPVPLFQMQTV